MVFLICKFLEYIKINTQQMIYMSLYVRPFKKCTKKNGEAIEHKIVIINNKADASAIFPLTSRVVLQMC